MKNENFLGKISIILGILGLTLYFIGLFFFSFTGNRLHGMGTGIIFGILAILLGYIAKKQKDDYGIYGISFGALILIIAVITFLFTYPIYWEIHRY